MSKRPWMLKLGLVLLIPLLGGCTFGDNRSLPYEDWSLRFFSPDYMEVWIETADVVDINERVFRGAGSGIPATGYPRGLSKGIPIRFRGDAKGWFKNPTGKGRLVRGSDLPRWSTYAGSPWPNRKLMRRTSRSPSQREKPCSWVKKLSAAQTANG